MSNYYISFDLDDTLFDNTPVIKHAFAVLYDYLIDQYPNLAVHYSLDSFITAAHETRNQHMDIVDYNVLRVIHIERVLTEVGYEKSTIDASKACDVFVDARQHVTFFDDTLPTVQTLADSYSLISISNGNADPERIGLSGFFKTSFNPTNCGLAKPDPEMYRSVCDQLDIEPGQMIHIGDSLTNDIFAAREAGCKTIWFNRLNKEDGVQPQIKTLSELPDIIYKMTSL